MDNELKCFWCSKDLSKAEYIEATIVGGVIVCFNCQNKSIEISDDQIRAELNDNKNKIRR